MSSLVADSQAPCFAGVTEVIVYAEDGTKALYGFLLGWELGASVAILPHRPESKEKDSDFDDVIDARLRSLIHSNARKEHVQGATTRPPELDRCRSEFKLTLNTSGSSGVPKAVEIGEKSVRFQAQAVAAALNVKSNDRQLFYMPINYVYGLSIVLTWLISGGVLAIPCASISRPSLLFAEIISRKITIFSGVPYTYSLLTKWGIAKLKNSHIRMLTQAGGRLKDRDLKELLELGPNIAVWIMYGQTEFSGRIAQYKPTLETAKRGCVGPPLPGIGVRVNEPNSDGEGEIYLDSPSICENASEFMDKRVWEGVPYYGTGDIGSFVDGQLFILGRNKNFVKIGGRRVAMTPIQLALESVLGIEACFICADEGKRERLLIGIYSNQYRSVQKQAEVVAALEYSGVEKSVFSNLLGRVPFRIFVLEGDIPRVENGKPEIWRINQILNKAAYEKQAIHIRL